MTVKEIVEKYLKDNSFDGLFVQGECACKLDDLFPCCCDGVLDCKPGYFSKCPDDCGEHGFHIGPNR